ncbi:dihydrodipicolinate synthetase [Lipomyces orientalis]|uniref:Dihydrodipicolinate synthetase n=1 Tax=Lipomyces orientalis TaxID=1233043 RepID=A0ACC3TEJ4_9ASCO
MEQFRLNYGGPPQPQLRRLCRIVTYYYDAPRSSSVTATTAIIRGVHVPPLTFFKDEDPQEIDWDFECHFRFLIEAGVHCVVIAGTNGETVTLTLVEKTKPHTPGDKSQSATETIHNLTALGQDAKANYALLLPASFFRFALTLDDTTAVPIVLYNFPTVAAGIDMDVHTLALLAEHPNIVGVKLTCGSVTKVVRLCRSISGVANLFPKTIVKLYYLYTSGKHDEALKLQRDIAECEVAFGIAGTQCRVRVESKKWFMHEKMKILTTYECEIMRRCVESE